MGLIHFTTLFRDIGQQETRVAVIPDGRTVPPGRYAFVEMYCSEPGCDCRRVMLQVVFEATEEVLAHISYGFDRDGSEMSGPMLDPLNKQSDLASHLLVLAESLLLSDEAYVARLQRHYAMFKARVEETAPASDKRHSLAGSFRDLFGFLSKRCDADMPEGTGTVPTPEDFIVILQSTRSGTNRRKPRRKRRKH